MEILVKPNICMAWGFSGEYELSTYISSLEFEHPNPTPAQKEDPYFSGKVSFFLDPFKQKFPTGFLSHVLSHLHSRGIMPDMRVVKYPLRPKIVVDKHVCDGMELFDYQEQLANLAISKGRGIITAPPRSGKTLIQAAVAKTLGLKSVLFVQRENLLDQHYKELTRWGMDPGIVRGKQLDVHKMHVVATMQTVWQQRDNPVIKQWIDEVEVMQIDEVHHAGSGETFYRTGLLFPSSFRLGYSGTPYDIQLFNEGRFHEDHWRLSGLCGPPVGSISVEYLQSIGRLVPITIYQIKMPEQDEIRAISGHNWHKVHGEGIVDNDLRNSYVLSAAQVLVAKGYMPLVLIGHISHGEGLFNKMRAVGLVPVFVKGGKKLITVNGNKSGGVNDAYNLLLNGGANIMIATSVGDEGVDVPLVNALIMATGGKASKVGTQRTFRPLTSAEGKTHAVVVDFDDRQHNVLKKHSAERRKTYKALGFNCTMLTQLQVLERIPPC